MLVNAPITHRLFRIEMTRQYDFKIRLPLSLLKREPADQFFLML